ncbi:MFS transporter [Rhodococcus sp. SRB_17]|nr:MFS transporter [Rhodococcus sp. SRB_17]
MNNPARRDGTPDRNNSRDSRGGRNDAPRGGRSEAPRGARGDNSYGARSDAPRGGRSEAPRGARSDNSYGSRNDAPRGARSDAPRGGRSENTYGSRNDAPRGARSDAPRGGRSENTYGSRNDAPRGARGDNSYGARSDAPRGARSDAPRGGRDNSYNARSEAPRGRFDAPRGARSEAPRGGRSNAPRNDDRRTPRADDRRTPHVDVRRAPYGTRPDDRNAPREEQRPAAPRGGAWSNAPRGSKFDGPPRKRPAAPTPPAVNKRGKVKSEKPQRAATQNPLVSNAKPARHQHAEVGQQDGPPKGDGVRLQKVLAQAGVASRRAAEELIDQGRVEVDGRIVREQGLRVDPENAVVRVDGVRVVVQKDLVYLAMNKPRGWQCTMSDDLGRPCVGDIVSERVQSGQRLFHVGRLDADTEGLLLLTNDGDLAHRLMHPSFEVPKTYLATVHGVLERSTAKQLREGVTLDDGPAKVDLVTVLEINEGKTLVKLVLHEGRKHIVRRLLDSVGHPVVRLVRTNVGVVALGDQRPGTQRVLGRSEVGGLYEAVGL